MIPKLLYRALLLSGAFVLWSWTVLAGEKAENWPQWRGPTRDSQVPGVAWPDTLQGDALKLLWRVELGQGYPGPIVAEDRVFVAETQDMKEEVVRALDRKTGKEIWKASWKGAMVVPFFAWENGSWIRSTPAYDGESLFVAGMRDLLVCLDAKTGKERWRVDFLERYKSQLPAFGFVSSPLVIDDHVYVQAGGSFVKLNKRTGDTIWRSMEDGGGMNGSAFSSPFLAKIQGQEQLLVQARTKLAGVDPKTGMVLWEKSIPAFRGMNILTPTVYGDGIFTSAYGAKSYLFRIDRDDKGFIAKEGWTNPAQGYMSSPVVIDGFAYVHLRNQRLTCIDLKTGETRWTTPKTFGKYWSMVTCQERILALDERGILYLIKANPEKYDQLDSRKVSDQDTWGHLAIAGDEIYIRELKAITAFRWQKLGSTQK